MIVFMTDYNSHKMAKIEKYVITLLGVALK